ncbi:MAG: bifunctional diguanylate cyclase/phosphodiesterase [Lachnospiraceae bacterium]|nr:bifunctional diguanylate cyclase/phosphodiesterase [Lachnospiraceae bacterium]
MGKRQDNKSGSDRAARSYTNNLHVMYDCTSGMFTYPSEADEQFVGSFDSRPLWQIMVEDGLSDKNTADRLKNKIDEICKNQKPQVFFTEYLMKNSANLYRWFRVGFVCSVPGTIISITFTDIDNEISDKHRLAQMTEYDELTGLMNRMAFCKAVEAMMQKDEAGVAAGEYALVFLDVIRFKAINEIFGMTEGDRLLRHIADSILGAVKDEDMVCRLGSDRFIFFTHTSGSELKEMIEKIYASISEHGLPIEITCNAGIYVTNGGSLAADSMIDRAVLAQSSIKGSYTVRYNFYTEAQRNVMLGEQEIVGMMATALAEKQFVVYYQPQYNHSTGMLVGAEALVRWKHPERGLISPGIFIPIFEKNGFITKLDLFVFEQVCEFLRKCIDRKFPVVPISTNFSRHDIFQPDFVESLEKIRGKYDVPARLLRVEITESAVMGSSQYTNEVVRKLHQHGYIVEMDDFGSGYSSLNVLKDIELDVIKLDMLFLYEQTESNRGGTILSSIIRMAKWLGMPVIAEGVETVGQADFLRSIGCDYIQGYLYSKPVPEEDYEKLISGSSVGATVPQMRLIDTFNACDFWDPKSQETLIFSNYVGGAAIFTYSEKDNKVEVLRVNQKYLQELCMNLSERDLIENDPMRFFDEQNKKIYIDMLKKAVETMEEQECETWRTIYSSCCGDERICIRSNVRMIGKSDDTCLFYAMIRNITMEKNRYSEMSDAERRFKMASEQVNIYFWEYTVATREMRPCFRCMRDLGLPALLTNYPDSAIERGIFPPEVADMYRDWHRQVAEGVTELEAIIPLTPNRIPFRVRYTTEFDENGRPVKAYGSAALIVD